jgi:hypothetical protein
MNALYEELQMLCTTDQATKAVQTAAIEGTPETFRKEMCRATRKHVVPPLPTGHVRLKDCFWFTFNVKGVWECAWGTNDEKKEKLAEWLKDKRETAQKRGAEWPPMPIFQKAFSLPQPNTGKE